MIKCICGCMNSIERVFCTKCGRVFKKSQAKRINRSGFSSDSDLASDFLGAMIIADALDDNNNDGGYYSDCGSNEDSFDGFGGSDDGFGGGGASGDWSSSDSYDSSSSYDSDSSYDGGCDCGGGCD